MLMHKVAIEHLTLAVCLDDTTESNDPNISTHTEDLKRHLARFGLEIESVSKDGDRAFRSIIRQLLKMDFDKNKGLEDHLRSLNLMAGSEDEDTFILRQLFVEEFIRGGGRIFGICSGIDNHAYRKS